MAAVPRVAALDQVHPSVFSAIVDVAVKLILFPQPIEIGFHVAVLLIVGKGSTVTNIVYLVPISSTIL